jgi:hypothetical protein
MDPHSYKWVTELPEHKSDHVQLPRSGICEDDNDKDRYSCPRNGTCRRMLIGPIIYDVDLAFVFVCLQKSRKVAVKRIPNLGKAQAMEGRIEGV